MKPFSPFRRGLSYWILLGGLALAGSSPLLAADRYFDQNGPLDGFGLLKDEVYDWDTSDEVWNALAGGTGTAFSAWDNDSGDIARFNLTAATAGQTVTVSLAENIAVGGIIVGPSSNLLKITAPAPAEPSETRTLTMAPNAEISMTGGVASLGLTIGDNVNLIGDFTLRNTGSNGQLRLIGPGSDYVGTVTIKGNTNGGLTLDPGTRFKDKTVIVLDSGRLTMGGGSFTIGGLSGAGGVIQASSGSTLVVKQTVDAQWAGQFGGGTGSRRNALTKEGAGRLTFAGSATSITHHIGDATAVEVKEGALYVDGAILSGTPAALTTTNIVEVANNATFGGSVTTDKRLMFSAAGSIVDPGMFGQAGTMTLGQGMSGSAGATFHFSLNGEGDEGVLANSLLRITGGVATLEGTKTVRFFDLGSDLIEMGVTYTLIDSSVALNSADWVYDLGSTGWGVESFGVVDNRLQVVFTAIPESSSVALMGLGMFAALVIAKRNRFKRHLRA